MLPAKGTIKTDSSSHVRRHFPRDLANFFMLSEVEHLFFILPRHGLPFFIIFVQSYLYKNSLGKCKMF